MSNEVREYKNLFGSDRNASELGLSEAIEGPRYVPYQFRKGQSFKINMMTFYAVEDFKGVVLRDCVDIVENGWYTQRD